jgi:hypothetical protein
MLVWAEGRLGRGDRLWDQGVKGSERGASVGHRETVSGATAHVTAHDEGRGRSRWGFSPRTRSPLASEWWGASLRQLQYRGPQRSDLVGAETDPLAEHEFVS